MRHLLIIPVLFAIWFSASKYLVAKNIECFTQFGQCSDSLSLPGQQLINTALLLPISNERLAQAYQNNPTVKSFRLFRRLPQTLVISVELRTPVGLIGRDLTGDSARLVDSSGYVLGASTNDQDPLLIVSDFNPEAKNVSQNYVAAIKILKKISELSDSRVMGNLDGSLVTATYNNGPKIIVDIAGNIDAWYFPLQQILKRSKISTKSPTKIDLRFSNPVLSY